MSPLMTSRFASMGRTSSPKRSRSMTRTRYPAASSLGTRIAPTYPAPPVTRTVPRLAPMSSPPIDRCLADVDRPPQYRNGPQGFQNIPHRDGLRAAVGTILMGQGHFDVAVPGPYSVHEHLGEEVEAPRRLRKGPGQGGRIEAGALELAHPM